MTSAAIIMVAVFGLFASLSLIMMQQMGFGLAIAVLIDATVVRAVLVPSTMKLLGEWNWYLPRGSSGCRRCRRSASRAEDAAAPPAAQRPAATQRQAAQPVRRRLTCGPCWPSAA